MSDPENRWIVVHCLDAFRKAHGQRGKHEIAPQGCDLPMTKDGALAALAQVEVQRPNEDFSIRTIAKVKELDVVRAKHTACEDAKLREPFLSITRDQWKTEPPARTFAFPKLRDD